MSQLIDLIQHYGLVFVFGNGYNIVLATKPILTEAGGYPATR